ncbi:carboxypeptidase-like regulatory domain-containing protein [Carboxylicivirga caseinilyticus]|uniref:carboxypeptidase-like regulatory domain-containing protein n=1 Tax=Carboxylicivirga caseinilyticus TaxID=3417572 RepID=UPI003D353393|nr:carboxypeptidase-like regulatory domain-containing protein [Marinilabiliaceae bacterium A049]
MKEFLLIVSLVFGVLLQVEAYTISGEVKDSLTNQPVEFANIYIDGTTIGTITGEDGQFELTYDMDYSQIVISHISYVSRIVNIDSKKEKRLSIRLIPKKIDIQQVTIESTNLRAANMDYFKKVFLGVDKWGKKAQILNDSVLYFDVQYAEKFFIPGKGPYEKFIATATEPLKILLPDLGYELRYDLVTFREQFNPEIRRNSIRIVGYSFFKELKINSERKEKKYLKNRKEAYNNSTMHFVRSMYENTLRMNGFLILETDTVSNPEGPEYKTFELSTCGCADFMLNEAWLSGLKGKEYEILYFYRGKKPLNLLLRKINLKDPRIKNSRCYIMKDICVIRKDGSLPGGEIIFDGDIINKRMGAALPLDIMFEN